MKTDLHIEIARTSNLPFSSMSDTSCEMIHDVLSQHYGHVGISTIDTLADLEILVRKQPDLVFLGLKKLPSTWSLGHNEADYVWVSEYLDARNINYTGSAKSAIALEFDKSSAKAQVRHAGLPTADSFTSSPGQYQELHNLPLSLPVFMKPLAAGGGAGIGPDSVVRTFQQFQDRTQQIFQEFGSHSLVEEYLTGREFSVAILERADSQELIAMPVELITEKNARGDRILGSQIKDDDTERVLAVRDTQLRDQLGMLAKNIYCALGARDYGRIDIRMDARGKAHFLEANLLPGLGTGYFFRACRLNQGMSYEEMILRITRLGLVRSKPHVALTLI